jgi:hypothetical protein
MDHVNGTSAQPLFPIRACTGACHQGRRPCTCAARLPVAGLAPVPAPTPAPAPIAAEASSELQASGWFDTDRRLMAEEQSAELRGFDLGQQIGYTKGWYWGAVCGALAMAVLGCVAMIVRGLLPEVLR